jgi:hypothetical protein
MGLGFSEFIQLAAHIASVKSAFMMENLAQGNRGAVTLDFDRLLFISSKVV